MKYKNKLEKMILELDDKMAYYIENHDEYNVNFKDWFNELFKENDLNKQTDLYFKIKQVEYNYLNKTSTKLLEESYYKLLDYVKNSK